MQIKCPDVLNWNKVKISIVTHGQGGLTENDFILATKVDAIQP
jgi:pterin-4a-carbinolamine dehydratase